MQLVVTPTTTKQAPVVPSSVASIGDKVCYLVDKINSPVPCSLVIRYEFNNNCTRKVATGLVILECQFHGREIPEDYCRVEVLRVVQGYKDNMLDSFGPHGIEKLGQAIKNFIFGFDGTSYCLSYHNHHPEKCRRLRSCPIPYLLLVHHPLQSCNHHPHKSCLNHHPRHHHLNHNLRHHHLNPLHHYWERSRLLQW